MRGAGAIDGAPPFAGQGRTIGDVTATLSANDMVRAAAFSDASAEDMGLKRMMEYETFIAWGGAAGIGLTKPFNSKPATLGNGVMVALEAKDKAQVHRLYDIELAHGGTCEGPPGPRGDSGFYAAYFRNPNANKLNAFIMG